MLRKRGGLPPPERRRSRLALTLAEREEISRGVAAGESARAIACRLQRAPSTVTRELDRHGGRAGYRAAEAELRAWQRGRRPQRCKLARQPQLAALVAAKLAEQWSPAADRRLAEGALPRGRDYAGVARDDLPDPVHPGARRPEARAGRAPAAGGLAAHAQERPAAATAARDRSSAPSRSPSARPRRPTGRSPATGRATCSQGSSNSQIATLVERHSRFVILVAVGRKDSRSVTEALSRQLARLPEQLRVSLTWDRGLEMAEHAAFTVATEVKVYFCDPRSPWQRGSNENTNGLLRQYLPKRANLNLVSQARLDEIATRLNTRPRQTLGFKTPADILDAALR